MGVTKHIFINKFSCKLSSFIKYFCRNVMFQSRGWQTTKFTGRLQNWQTPVSVNSFLLEHSRTQSPTYYLWLLGAVWQRLSGCNRDHRTCQANTVIIWSSTEKLCLWQSNHWCLRITPFCKKPSISKIALYPVFWKKYRKSTKKIADIHPYFYYWELTTVAYWHKNWRPFFIEKNHYLDKNDAWLIIKHQVILKSTSEWTSLNSIQYCQKNHLLRNNTADTYVYPNRRVRKEMLSQQCGNCIETIF